MRKLFIYLLLLSSINQYIIAKQRVTNLDRNDGFGAQFQTLIYAVIYADLHNLDFVYSPFNKMEHNYDNDPTFLAKKEWLINFKDNFEINIENAPQVGWDVIDFFEKNLDICVKSKALQKIKRIFRENKNRNNYFDCNRFNIVIHARRPNSQDNRLYGADVPDDIYLSIISERRTA